MATIRLELPRYHDGQQRVVEGSKRFNVLACGRRWGKTAFGLNRLILKAIAGQTTSWLAPTYGMLDEPFREAIRLCDQVTDLVEPGKRQIRLIGGGTIKFRSVSKPDRFRGTKNHWVVFDEAAYATDCDRIFDKIVRPTLTDYRGGCDFLCSPRGKNGFWRLYQRGLDDKRLEWSSFRMPTASNPLLPAGEVESARLDMPDSDFRQEYGAEFIDEGAGVFPHIASAIMPNVWGPVPFDPAMAPYVAGLDLAKTSDFTVLSIFDRTGKQVWLDRWQRLPWTATVERAAHQARPYKPFLMPDATGVGDPIVEALEAYIGDAFMGVEGFKFTGSNKPQVVKAYQLALEQGSMKLLDNTVQTAEHEAYEYVLKSGGGTSTSAPSGLHDDIVAANILAWNAINSYRPMKVW